MKLELRENMYVRTKDGRMGKLMGYMAFNENKIAIWTNTTEKDIKITPVIDKDAIIKASYSIIDILEVGDYVNGSKVIEIEKDYKFIDNEIRDILWLDNKRNNAVWKETIKSIVTKEQFSSMEYKLGDDK